eukprot:685078-Pyramimonas_sp.AAC.1
MRLRHLMQTLFNWCLAGIAVTTRTGSRPVPSSKLKFEVYSFSLSYVARRASSSYHHPRTHAVRLQNGSADFLVRDTKCADAIQIDCIQIETKTDCDAISAITIDASVGRQVANGGLASERGGDQSGYRRCPEYERGK